jgi:simple sugar transport system permease protein
MQGFTTLFQLKEAGVTFALIAVMSVFAIISNHFLSLATMNAIALTSTEIGIIAIGATLLMIAGEFDLSIGSNFALCGMMFALTTTTFGVNSYSALLLVLVMGGLIGFFNGFITLKTNIPSFITTLGTMMILRGVVLIVTDGFPIAALAHDGLMSLLNSEWLFGFKTSLLVWLFLGGVAIYILNFHPFGSVIMATGGNVEAAFSMGIKVTSAKLICFIASGVLAALAGVIQFAHLMSLSPTAGEQYELRAIAIAVIGGTSLAGGFGTIVGTMLATVIMGLLASGLVLAGVSTYWFRALVGMILVLAVIMNTSFKRIKEKTVKA